MSSSLRAAWGQSQGAWGFGGRLYGSTLSFRNPKDHFDPDFRFRCVPYGQDKSARLDFRGFDARNPATKGDTLWVNYSTRRFSSRSMAF